MNVLWKSAFAAAMALAGGWADNAMAATWTLGDWYQYSGNDHYYSVQAITGPLNGWSIAESQAQAMTFAGAPVTLASITSAAIDQFIFAGVDDPTYWSLDTAGNNEGPNIGGYQTDKLAEPNGHWAWSNGDAWSYTQWAAGEPSNGNGTEDYATLFCNTGTGCRSGNWNDISNATSTVGTQGSIHYYIAEICRRSGWVGARTRDLGDDDRGLWLLRRRDAASPWHPGNRIVRLSDCTIDGAQVERQAPRHLCHAPKQSSARWRRDGPDERSLVI